MLKEMVKSANMQAKAKDIDIQRLTKKIQRMEKMVELGGRVVGSRTREEVIEEQDERMEQTDQFYHQGDLGLNPVNYSSPSIAEEVNRDLLMAQ